MSAVQNPGDLNIDNLFPEADLLAHVLEITQLLLFVLLPVAAVLSLCITYPYFTVIFFTVGIFCIFSALKILYATPKLDVGTWGKLKFAWGKYANSWFAWLCSAAAFEILMWTWAASSISVQLFCTFATAALVYLYCDLTSQYGLAYVMSWVAARVCTVAIAANHNAELAWYASQVILLCAVCGNVCFSSLSIGNTAHRTAGLLASLVAVIALYSSTDTIPPGISIFPIMVPLLYLMVAALQYDLHDFDKTVYTMFKTCCTVGVVVCVVICMASSQAERTMSRSECSADLYNTQVCTSRHQVKSYVPGCCCEKGFYPVLNTLGCASAECVPTQQKNANNARIGRPLVDCCGKPIVTDSYNNFRAGKDMCICGNTLLDQYNFNTITTTADFQAIQCNCSSSTMTAESFCTAHR